jgi:hypothetical protein
MPGVPARPEPTLGLADTGCMPAAVLMLRLSQWLQPRATADRAPVTGLSAWPGTPVHVGHTCRADHGAVPAYRFGRRALDQLGTGAEGGIVHERAAINGARVHLQFLPAGEGIKAGDGPSATRQRQSPNDSLQPRRPPAQLWAQDRTQARPQPAARSARGRRRWSAARDRPSHAAGWHGPRNVARPVPGSCRVPGTPEGDRDHCRALGGPWSLPDKCVLLVGFRGQRSHISGRVW